uniref:Dihydropteridine reductase n=1 Tax=Schistocephalus solidus TaxID=70667 RepID=A0A0X3PHY4_SCHSO
MNYDFCANSIIPTQIFFKMQNRVIVYGGAGGLGSATVAYLKAKGLWVCSVASKPNKDADANVLITNRTCLEEQDAEVKKGVKEVLGDKSVDAILCVAGGWAGGNCSGKGFIKNVDCVVKQSIWSSSIAASLSSSYLRPGGTLVLSGASSAMSPTPGMVAYGMAKAAVHHMTQSLASKGSGLPSDAFIAAILPSTLDTPMNRKWMPDADHSKWTPLNDVAELLYDWIQGKNRPPSGSLVELKTEGGKTNAIPVKTT